MAQRICSVPSCDKPHVAKGFCKTHWYRWRTQGDPTAPPLPAHKPAIERFLAKVREDSQGCWIWQGQLNHNGYGVFSDARRFLAHRWSYEHFIGAVPEGLELDHLCRIPRCCNPRHLEAVTHQVNINRGTRHIPKTHCKNGHAFTPDNTYLRYGYQQICRACQREANRRYRLRRKATVAMEGQET